MEDITLRALRTLREADFILAEDTRTTSVLLAHHDIHRPLISYHKFNEHACLPNLLARLRQADSAALVSDAGTPGISDPGFLLVRACVAEGISVETLPGPTALIPALVSSALPCDRFAFEGFLPTKKGRRSRMEQIAREERTVVLYESPHRLAKTLSQLAELCAEREACVCREISKLHEEHRRGTLADLAQYYADNPPRGEIVIVISQLHTTT